VLAVDVLAAAPLLSATTLAAAAAGIVVEVTHRTKQRLFGAREAGAAARPGRPATAAGAGARARAAADPGY
jgi:hypothetical protein